jgi:hypothetical protein
MAVPIDGGPPTVLEDSLLTPETVSWGSDGYLYGTALQNGITRREAHAGSKPEFVTTVDTAAGEQTHLYPELLPDGKTCCSTSTTAVGSKGLPSVYSATASTSHCSTAFALVMRPAATCCTRRGRALWAVPFDPKTRTTSGTAIQVADRIPRRSLARSTSPCPQRDPGLFNGGCQHPSRADLGVAHRGAFTVRLDVEG